RPLGLPPRSPLFPYTTLFRSQFVAALLNDLGIELTAFGVDVEYLPDSEGVLTDKVGMVLRILLNRLPFIENMASRVLTHRPAMRSEEHTSELQSRENLVCRLL